VVAVPYDEHAGLLQSPVLMSKVVRLRQPLGFDQQGAYARRRAGLGRAGGGRDPAWSTVVAPSTTSAALLTIRVSSVDTDVLVLGDDRDATGGGGRARRRGARDARCTAVVAQRAPGRALPPT
jgi:hypothetical protein